MSETYRPITTEELIALSRQITEAASIAARRTLIQRLYGPTAARAEIAAESEYDDEGGYYWSIQSLTVTDAAGEALAPDPAGFLPETFFESVRYDDRYYLPLNGRALRSAEERDAYRARVVAQLTMEFAGLALWRAANPDLDWAEQEEFAHLLSAMNDVARNEWDNGDDLIFPPDPAEYNLLEDAPALPTLFTRV